MPLFSIIVPIYNVEKYLKECLDSILNQTFKDFELILINDGSTDNSGEIANEYSKKYNNIKIIHKENGGLSSSRNAGVKISSGEYLLFIDSDDLLANTQSLSNIVPYLDNNDLILLKFEKLYFDKSIVPVIKEINEEFRNIKIENMITSLINTNCFVSSACNKCINKNYFTINNLFFREGIFSEDVDWSIRLLLSVRSISFSNYPYYLYRQSREGSISTTVNNKHIEDYCNSINLSLDLINNSNVSFERQKSILNFLAYQYMVIMAYYPEIEGNILKSELKKLGYLLNYDAYKKVRIINLLRKLIGFNLTTLLMNKFVRNRK